jgi:hypothetical protein
MATESSTFARALPMKRKNIILISVVGLASVIFALPELLALIPGWRDMAFDLSSAGTTG